MALLASGLAWISYGFTISTNPRYSTTRGITVLLDLMPLWAWGLVWIICGALCLIFAPRPAGRDLPGFVGAFVPAALWAVAYGLGGFAGNGYSTWTAVAPWLSHAFLILIVARVTRAEVVTPVVRRHDDGSN